MEGRYAQQDAEECWTSSRKEKVERFLFINFFFKIFFAVISSLKRTLPAENGKTPIANLFEGEFKGKHFTLNEVCSVKIMLFFSFIVCVVIRRNTELSEAEEKPAESQLNFLKLRLPISNDTRYITEVKQRTF